MLPLIRIWTLGVLSILISVIFVGANIVVKKEQLLDGLRTEMDQQVSRLAMDLDRTLYGVQQQLGGLENYLAASPGNTIPYSSEIRRTLQKLVDENPFLSTLLVLDAEGQVINWNHQGRASSQARSDFFLAHLQEVLPDIFLGGPRQSPLMQGRWGFGISRAVRTVDGSLSRVLVALVDLERLNAHFRGIPLPPESTMTIASPDGFIYSRFPEYETLVGRRIPNLAVQVNLADATLAIQKTSPIDGQVDLLAARRTGSYPLIAVLAQREETVLKRWRADSLPSVGLGLSFSLMILLLTIQTARCHRHQVNARNNLHQQAITDPLTNIFNRRYALEQAQLEIKKAQRNGANLSFMLLDLDHFKSVNDRFGHVTGDRVLVATANILKGICRATDIVSRFGGEEFLLVLPDTNLVGAMIMAEKIRAAIAGRIHHCEGREFSVTASFGVAEWNVKELEVLDVLRRTDVALYEVKSNGRNRIKCSLHNGSANFPTNQMSWRFDRL